MTDLAVALAPVAAAVLVLAGVAWRIERRRNR